MSRLLVTFAFSLLLLLGLRDASWGRWFAHDLTVYVFDIGQGDAIFVDGPEKQILIDGGPDARVVERLTEVLPWWDRSIDAILNTHPDADHTTGLLSVLARYHVGLAYETGQLKNTPVFRAWTQEVVTPHEIVHLGQVIDLGGGATLTVVGPLANIDGQTLTDPNDGSIILDLRYGDFSMLLTGDGTIAEEDQMIATGTLSDVDILKVGHHGSITSTGNEFLGVIKPEVAMISVGASNDYGHPRLETIMHLESHGVWIHRTDREGTIRIVSGGHGYAVTTRH